MYEDRIAEGLQYKTEIDILHEEGKDVLFLRPKKILKKRSFMLILKMDQYNKKLTEKLIQDHLKKRDITIEGTMALADYFNNPRFFNGYILVDNKPKYKIFLPTTEEGTEIYASIIRQIND